MMEAYLHQLDALLSASPLVRDVEIVRRSMRDTEFEKDGEVAFLLQPCEGCGGRGVAQG